MPPDAWYFDADRQDVMPFVILLEAALQPCGWLAAYLGAALTSPDDLCFRNLGGKARTARPGRPRRRHADHARPPHRRVALGRHDHRRRSTSPCAIGGGIVYEGNTNFGFFSRQALAQQVGVPDASLYEMTAAERTAAAQLRLSDGRAVPRDDRCA